MHQAWHCLIHMDESQLVTTMTPIASALGRWSPSFSSHTGETVAPEDKRRCRYNVAGRHLFLATNHASLSNLNISWNNNRISKTRMSRPNTQILSNYIKLNCFTSSDIHPSPSSFTNDWQEFMKRRRAIWIFAACTWDSTAVCSHGVWNHSERNAFCRTCL